MSTSSLVASELYDVTLSRWRLPALIVGVVLLIASCIGGVFDPTEFFSSYLFSFLFWLGITLGCMAIVMMQYLTGGAWGEISRRTFEAGSRTLPLTALLFIPIIIGIPRLYAWSHPQIVLADDILKHRSGYMNPTMYVVRAIVYFAIWGVLTYFLNRWSQDEDARGGMRERLGRLSAPGLILYVFTITFASVDWSESLANHWFSTMGGFLFVASQGLSAMGFGIVVLALLSRNKPMRDLLRPSHFHDLGKLLLMFVMLWAYFAFSQLLIVWSGNLSNEIPWYMPRFATTWAGVGLALVLVQFAIPFLLLLSRPLKRNPVALSLVVGIVLVMRLVDMYWVVEPQFHPGNISVYWLNISLPLALGGVWISYFLWQLGKLPLLPVRSPALEKALHHGE